MIESTFRILTADTDHELEAKADVMVAEGWRVVGYTTSPAGYPFVGLTRPPAPPSVEQCFPTRYGVTE